MNAYNIDSASFVSEVEMAQDEVLASPIYLSHNTELF